MPYLVLIILVIFGSTLEGASDGIEFYLKPNMTKLYEGKVWLAAATQIFYSLGIGFGSLMTMSSYNKFNNNILTDTLIVSLGNCFSSVFAGFGIFSFLGHMAYKNCLEVKHVVASGPGLAFIAYPEALALLPAAQVFCVLFFIMLILLGLDSQFAYIDTLTAAIVDEYPEYFQKGRRKTYLVLFWCVVCLLLGIPLVCQGGYHLFNLINDYSAYYGLLLVAFSFAIVIFYVYNFITTKMRFLDDVKEMIGDMHPVWSWYFKSMWFVGAPVLLVIMLLYSFVNYTTIADSYSQAYGYENAHEIYPKWSNTLAMMVSFASFVPIPVYFIYKTSKHGLDALKPSSGWRR
jgi:SNF family Na+-dependent transporter